ncbi:MAG: hypothetical protein C4342_04385 [Armatimonadota bacterium]
MTKKVLDPEAYIESAFLDEDFEEVAEPSEDLAPEVGAEATIDVKTQERRDGEAKRSPNLVVEAVRIANELKTKKPAHATDTPKVKPEPVEEEKATVKRAKTRKVGLNAPRPRRRKTVISSDLEAAIKEAPKNLQFLATLFDDSVTEKYYTKKFKEPREEFIRRLIDPELNLEEAARLLGVCPATVRRYTNRGWLDHHRTSGNQRRFRLSNIVRFVEQYGRHPD